MDYLYDGTFEGLLTCIYCHYKEAAASGIYLASNYQQTIINNYKVINTDIKKAQIVSNAIKKISGEAYIEVYYCYLSNACNKENIILDFLIFAFKYGKKTMNFYTHEKVLPLKEISLKVTKEVDKFLDFLILEAFYLRVFLLIMTCLYCLLGILLTDINMKNLLFTMREETKLLFMGIIFGK